MRRWLWLAIWLMATPAFALEIPLTSGGALSLGIPIRITTVEGDPVTAQTLATIDLYYACSGQTRTLFNEVGDTLPEIDPTAYPGDYYLVSNDVLTACTPPNVMQVRGTGTDLVISAPLVEVVSSNGSTVVVNFDTATGTLAASQLETDVINASKVAADTLGASEVAADFFSELLLGIGGVYGTLSAGSTGTSLISTAFVGTDTTDYVGWIAVANNGASVVQAFNPATDTVTLAATIGTVATGNNVWLVPGSFWEMLSRLRAGR